MNKFDYVKKYVISFGKYKGKTIDQIAQTDDGLKYLDWLYGETNNTTLKDFLKIYLNDETIKKELDKILGN